jgi:xanthine dehydrogenase molybdopterin-binding subunit B
MEEQLVMKLLFADRPHARVLNIDLNKAQAVPGVVRNLHRPRCANQRIRPAVPDQPVCVAPEDL